jgi:hypothetical protein
MIEPALLLCKFSEVSMAEWVQVLVRSKALSKRPVVPYLEILLRPAPEDGNTISYCSSQMVKTQMLGRVSSISYYLIEILNCTPNTVDPTVDCHCDHNWFTYWRAICVAIQ